MILVDEFLKVDEYIDEVISMILVDEFLKLMNISINLYRWFYLDEFLKVDEYIDEVISMNLYCYKVQVNFPALTQGGLLGHYSCTSGHLGSKHMTFRKQAERKIHGSEFGAFKTTYSQIK